MQAVILAAGKGTRLKAKTDALPKAMIEIEGKPLLEYSLDALIEYGSRSSKGPGTDFPPLRQKTTSAVLITL